MLTKRCRFRYRFPKKNPAVPKNAGFSCFYCPWAGHGIRRSRGASTPSRSLAPSVLLQKKTSMIQDLLALSLDLHDAFNLRGPSLPHFFQGLLFHTDPIVETKRFRTRLTQANQEEVAEFVRWGGARNPDLLTR